MSACELCGSEYVKVKPWQRYCSSACRSLEMNSRKRTDRRVKFCRTCQVDVSVDRFESAHRSCKSCEALAASGVKKCKTCGDVKPNEEFYPRRGRGAFSSACKRCCSERSRKWNSRPEIKERVRERHLQSRFGVSLEQYDELLSAQGGRCAICQDLPTAGYSLHVDHDHRCCPTENTCGKCIRGLLCYRCNVALGSLRESVDIAEKSVVYLRKFQ